MSQIVRHAHDRFFKQSMANPRVAQDFFDQYLPTDLKNIICFKALTLCPESFVDKTLKLNVVDLLYQVNFNDSPGYLYILLEHQSSADWEMPLRIHRYTLQILEKHLQNYPECKRLPIVYPIVLYHQPKPYPYSNDIYSLFGSDEVLARKWVFQPFHLIDLSQISDEQLKQKHWSGIMTWLLKHVYARNFIHSLSQVWDLLKTIHNSGDNDYLKVIIEYILRTGDIAEEQELAKMVSKHLSSELGETVMTLGETIFERGRHEGRSEGRNEGRNEGVTVAKQQIAKMLEKENVAKGVIEKILQMPIETA